MAGSVFLGYTVLRLCKVEQVFRGTDTVLLYEKYKKMKTPHQELTGTAIARTLMVKAFDLWLIVLLFSNNAIFAVIYYAVLYTILKPIIVAFTTRGEKKEVMLGMFVICNSVLKIIMLAIVLGNHYMGNQDFSLLTILERVNNE